MCTMQISPHLIRKHFTKYDYHKEDYDNVTNLQWNNLQEEMISRVLYLRSKADLSNFLDDDNGSQCSQDRYYCASCLCTFDRLSCFTSHLGKQNPWSRDKSCCKKEDLRRGLAYKLTCGRYYPLQEKKAASKLSTSKIDNFTDRNQVSTLVRKDMSDLDLSAKSLARIGYSVGKVPQQFLKSPEEAEDLLICFCF